MRVSLTERERRRREVVKGGGEGGTHDEVTRVREEELADLETLWPEIGVEPGWELVMAWGPLRCGSDDEVSVKEVSGCTRNDGASGQKRALIVPSLVEDAGDALDPFFHFAIFVVGREARRRF